MQKQLSKCSRDHPRAPPNSLASSKQLTQKPKQTNIRQDTSGVMRKEVYTDKAAVVEVTVKTVKPHASPSRSNTSSPLVENETWGKLLKTGKSIDSMSKAQTFDPLRTLHFLVNELHRKLKHTDDINIQQIIFDICNLLHRIPTEVVTTASWSPLTKMPNRRACSLHRQQRAQSSSRKMTQNKPTEVSENIPKLKTIGCQTTESNMNSMTVETDKFKKQIEVSTRKFETNCKELETLCNRLKRENEEVELLLKAEKDTVKYLRKQIEDIKLDKNKETEMKVERLKSENSVLQLKMQETKTENAVLHQEVKKLRSQLDVERNPSIQELKSIVNDLNSQKSKCEQEIIILKHHLAKVNMEKEKFQAICNLRTKQVEDIQAEMVELQKIIDENIVDLQQTIFQSLPSNLDNDTGNINMPWIDAQTMMATLMKTNHMKKLIGEQFKIEDIGNNAEPSTINSEESLRALFLNDNASDKPSYRDLPSGDSSDILDKVSFSEKSIDERPYVNTPRKTVFENIAPGFSNSPDAQSNIRDLFSKLKKQALEVCPAMYSQFNGDSDTQISNISTSDR